MPRLDAALVQRGMAQSRQRAKQLIQDGQVSVDGTVRRKASFVVLDENEITLSGSDIPYVGRGGLKLERALEQGRIDLHGLICLDIGASTGGFTDCMLQRGAARVYAVDVGHGQLAEALRQDSRVVNMEGTDIRHVTVEQLGSAVDFFSVDVSFISLRLVLPAAAELLRADGMAAVLIKPQFEAGRENIGKNGLVTSEKAHLRVLTEMLELFPSLGLSLQLLCPSPIRGGSGNAEYLAVLKKSDAPSVKPDAEAIVKAALHHSH